MGGHKGEVGVRGSWEGRTQRQRDGGVGMDGAAQRTGLQRRGGGIRSKGV